MQLENRFNQNGGKQRHQIESVVFSLFKKHFFSCFFLCSSNLSLFFLCSTNLFGAFFRTTDKTCDVLKSSSLLYLRLSQKFLSFFQMFSKNVPENSTSPKKWCMNIFCLKITVFKKLFGEKFVFFLFFFLTIFHVRHIFSKNMIFFISEKHENEHKLSTNIRIEIFFRTSKKVFIRFWIQTPLFLNVSSTWNFFHSQKNRMKNGTSCGERLSLKNAFYNKSRMNGILFLKSRRKKWKNW